MKNENEVSVKTDKQKIEHCLEVHFHLLIMKAPVSVPAMTETRAIPPVISVDVEAERENWNSKYCDMNPKKPLRRIPSVAVARIIKTRGLFFQTRFSCSKKFLKKNIRLCLKPAQKPMLASAA